MNRIEEFQKKFYRDKFKRYGDDPRALSWNDRKTQMVRFQSLAELFMYEVTGPYTVHEAGCGLAHFKEVLDRDYPECIYSGSDILPEFIEHDRERYPDGEFTVQNIGDEFDRISESVKGKDYYCVSGTFNAIGDCPLTEWEGFISRSIENMFRMASKGIGFNFLSSFSGYHCEDLYYANPGTMMNWCVKNISRFTMILHNTPLYEFTVLVYKEAFFQELFPGLR